MTMSSLEYNRIEYAPEIDDIRLESALLLAHGEIAHLRGLNLLQRLRHIGVERREQSWRMTNTFGLQFRAI